MLATYVLWGLFSDPSDELVRRRPLVARIDLSGASHGASFDDLGDWIDVLTRRLGVALLSVAT